MKINRAWSMPNRWTFEMKPINELLARYSPGKNWVDPFCGKSDIAEYRNDINPDNEVAQTHLFAPDFLAKFEPNSIDGVLFDPPYSPRQMSECYKFVGLKVTNVMTRTGWPQEKEQISRILKAGGLVISFGWNTSCMGKTRGFEIVEILIVAHGGGHNDTLCTVERKI